MSKTHYLQHRGFGTVHWNDLSPDLRVPNYRACSTVRVFGNGRTARSLVSVKIGQPAQSG